MSSDKLYGCDMEPLKFGKWIQPESGPKPPSSLTSLFLIPRLTSLSLNGALLILEIFVKHSLRDVVFLPIRSYRLLLRYGFFFGAPGESFTSSHWTTALTFTGGQNNHALVWAPRPKPFISASGAWFVFGGKGPGTEESTSLSFRPHGCISWPLGLPLDCEGCLQLQTKEESFGMQADAHGPGLLLTEASFLVPLLL